MFYDTGGDLCRQTEWEGFMVLPSGVRGFMTYGHLVCKTHRLSITLWQSVVKLVYTFQLVYTESYIVCLCFHVFLT